MVAPHLKRFLEPLNDNPPCGQDIRWSDEYFQMQELRIYPGFDGFGMPSDLPPTLEPAHQEKWQELIRLSEEVLTQKSKDLQVCGWYAEARLNTEGFTGFAEGLELMAALCEEYWDTLQPLDGEGQFYSRIAIFQWLGDFIPQIIERFPIGASSSSQEALSLYLLKARLESDPLGAGSQAQEDIVGSFSEVDAEELDKAYGSLSQCLNALDTLERFIPKMITEGFWGEPPSLKSLSQACQRLRDLFDSAYQRQGRTPGESPTVSPPRIDDSLRIQSEPAIQDAWDEIPLAHSSNNFLASSSRGGLYLDEHQKAQIQTEAHNRRYRINPQHGQRIDLEQALAQGFASCDEAYGALHRAYQYLAVHEPHSPTIFLLRRALDWQTKSLFDLYSEILKNKASPQKAFFDLLGLGTKQ